MARMMSTAELRELLSVYKTESSDFDAISIVRLSDSGEYAIRIRHEIVGGTVRWATADDAKAALAEALPEWAAWHATREITLRGESAATYARLARAALAEDGSITVEVLDRIEAREGDDTWGAEDVMAGGVWWPHDPITDPDLAVALAARGVGGQWHT